MLGFKVNILKSNVCEMYHSTLNNIIDLKSTIFPLTYLSCECVCNIDISQHGHNFWFLKANNFTKWQHASRTEGVVSENYYVINLEQTGVAVKCYKVDQHRRLILLIYKTFMICLYPNQQPQVTAVSLALQIFKQSIIDCLNIKRPTNVSSNNKNIKIMYFIYTQRF